MNGSSLTVARYVLIEARRSGLPWLARGLRARGAGPLGFSVPGCNHRGRGAAGLGCRRAAARLRRVPDRRARGRERGARGGRQGLELALALPISRSAWYLGKLVGFAVRGALLAALFALPLLLWAAPRTSRRGALRSPMETALVAAAALFFASALGQTVAAIAATAGLYLLARALFGDPGNRERPARRRQPGGPGGAGCWTRSPCCCQDWTR
jgi:hypothetical protein